MSPHAPRTDPGGRYSRTGLPPWVFDGEAYSLATGAVLRCLPTGYDARWQAPAIQPVGHAFPARCPARAALDRVPLGPFPWLHRLRHYFRQFCSRLRGVGSEEAPTEGLASVRRSNWTCSFPASSFHEWVLAI